LEYKRQEERKYFPTADDDGLQVAKPPAK